MYSTEQFVKLAYQPRGGFVALADLAVDVFHDGKQLNLDRSLNSTIIKTAVNCLTTLVLTEDIDKAFSTCLIGAKHIDDKYHCDLLLEFIYRGTANGKIQKRLSSKVIMDTCKVAGYDIAYRLGSGHYKDVRTFAPSVHVLDSIGVMVERSVAFFKQHNVIDTGITFEGAYTPVLSKGGADYLTGSGIWDLNVSAGNPSKEDTLQILLGAFLARRSRAYKTCNIEEIGIFNPRLNIGYSFELKYLSPRYLKRVMHVMDNGLDR